MVQTPLRWLTPVIFCAAVVAAQAQPATLAPRPDPLDAETAVPTLVYQSAFTQYRPLGEERPISWREANDTVTRVGGWRAYAREAQQPESGPAANPGSVTAPPAGPGGQGKP